MSGSIDGDKLDYEGIGMKRPVTPQAEPAVCPKCHWVLEMIEGRVVCPNLGCTVVCAAEAEPGVSEPGDPIEELVGPAAVPQASALDEEDGDNSFVGTGCCIEPTCDCNERPAQASAGLSDEEIARKLVRVVPLNSLFEVWFNQILIGRVVKKDIADGMAEIACKGVVAAIAEVRQRDVERIAELVKRDEKRQKWANLALSIASHGKYDCDWMFEQLTLCNDHEYQLRKAAEARADSLQQALTRVQAAEEVQEDFRRKAEVVLEAIKAGKGWYEDRPSGRVHCFVSDEEELKTVQQELLAKSSDWTLLKDDYDSLAATLEKVRAIASPAGHAPCRSGGMDAEEVCPNTCFCEWAAEINAALIRLLVGYREAAIAEVRQRDVERIAELELELQQGMDHYQEAVTKLCVAEARASSLSATLGQVRETLRQLESEIRFVWMCGVSYCFDIAGASSTRETLFTSEDGYLKNAKCVHEVGEEYPAHAPFEVGVVRADLLRKTVALSSLAPVAATNSNPTKRKDDMKPHQERVVTEKADLNDKLGKLLDFIEGGKGKVYSTLVTEERERLTTQARIMREYSDILADRIAAF
jgi:hypothetical protein